MICELDLKSEQKQRCREELVSLARMKLSQRIPVIVHTDTSTLLSPKKEVSGFQSPVNVHTKKEIARLYCKHFLSTF